MSNAFSLERLCFTTNDHLLHKQWYRVYVTFQWAPPILAGKRFYHYLPNGSAQLMVI